MTVGQVIRKPRASPPKVRNPAPGKELTLKQLQELFQQAVVADDDTIHAYICDNSRIGRDGLFNVYRHAYVGRLIDILAQDHEVLYQYLGHEVFRDLGRAYVAATPSRHSSARWVSQALPSFLARTEPYSEHLDIVELARLEQALNTAFDARDASAIAIADLARVAPEQWVALQFAPHPSAIRLDMQTNAFNLWHALKSDEEPPSAEILDEKQRLLIWREDETPMVRPMDSQEAMMWDEAAKGVRFGVLCELLATFDDPNSAPMRAAGYLQGWIGSGLLTGAAVGSPKHAG